MKSVQKFLLIIATPILALLALTTLSSSRVVAASLPKQMTQFAACSGNNAQLFGFPAWDACLPHRNGEIVIDDLREIWLVAIPIVESLIRAAAYVAVGFVIWGSILFIKSQGNPGNIASARDTIRDALIGLGIAVSSVALIQYFASKF